MLERWFGYLLSLPSLILAGSAAIYAIYTRLQDVSLDGMPPSTSVLLFEVLNGKAVAVVAIPVAIASGTLLAGSLSRIERRLRFGNRSRHSFAVIGECVSRVSATVVLSVIAVVACSVGPQGKASIDIPPGVFTKSLEQLFSQAGWAVNLAQIVQLVGFCSILMTVVILVSVWSGSNRATTAVALTLYLWLVVSEATPFPGLDGYRTADFAQYAISYIHFGPLPLHLVLVVLALPVLWATSFADRRGIQDLAQLAVRRLFPIVFVLSLGLLFARFSTFEVAERTPEAFLWGEGSPSLSAYLTSLLVYLLLPASLTATHAIDYLARRYELMPRFTRTTSFWWHSFKKDLLSIIIVSGTLVIAAFGAMYISDINTISNAAILRALLMFFVVTAQMAAVGLLIWCGLAIRGRVEDALWMIVAIIVGLSPPIASQVPYLVVAVPFLNGQLKNTVLTFGGTAGLLALATFFCLNRLNLGRRGWIGARN